MDRQAFDDCSISSPAGKITAHSSEKKKKIALKNLKTFLFVTTPSALPSSASPQPSSKPSRAVPSGKQSYRPLCPAWTRHILRSYNCYPYQNREPSCPTKAATRSNSLPTTVAPSSPLRRWSRSSYQPSCRYPNRPSRTWSPVYSNPQLVPRSVVFLGWSSSEEERVGAWPASAPASAWRWEVPWSATWPTRTSHPAVCSKWRDCSKATWSVKDDAFASCFCEIVDHSALDVDTFRYV